MNERKVTQVRDVMKTEVAIIDGLRTVREALDMMRDRGTTVLIVKKRSEDDEYGMLLVTDIARQVLAEDRAPDRVNVYEIMSKPVITVRPSMDVRYTARMFDNFGLSVAPVLHSGEVLGIVSYDDIVLGTVGEEAPMLPPSAD